MSAPRPGTSYLSDARSVALHETFVRNVMTRLNELGLLWQRADIPSANGAMTTQFGRPKFEELERMSGVPYRTLQNMLNLNNSPTLAGAARLARAIGVPLDKLLGQEDCGVPTSTALGNRLVCWHNMRDNKPDACEKCTRAWQSYQSRLRALYEANRAEARQDADAALVSHKAIVAAQGLDPDDVKR